jgi:hypothetical protein
MTSRDPIAACPQCGENTSRLTYTELVVTCDDDFKVAEWSECGRCHRWLAFRIVRDGETRPR